MEKARVELSQFLKNNAWGIIVAAAVIISNFTILSAKTDEMARTLTDHENRIRTMELRQEMIIEKLKNIEENTKYLREHIEERKEK